MTSGGGGDEDEGADVGASYENPRTASGWIRQERGKLSFHGDPSKNPRTMQNVILEKEHGGLQGILSKKQMKREAIREKAEKKFNANLTSDMDGKGGKGKGKGKKGKGKGKGDNREEIEREKQEEKMKKREGVSTALLDPEMRNLFLECVKPLTKEFSPENCMNEIARVSQHILADPHKELGKKFPFLLELHDSLKKISRESKGSKQPLAKQISYAAFVSATLVMKDVVPNYRIRDHAKTKQEEGNSKSGKGPGLGQLLKKSVLLNQKYEIALLKNYELLVDKLVALLREEPTIYVDVLCQLVDSAAVMGFNSRNKLLQPLLKLSCFGQQHFEDEEAEKKTNKSGGKDKDPSRSIVQRTCECIRLLIERDRGLEVTKALVAGTGELAKRAAIVRRKKGGGKGGEGNKGEGKKGKGKNGAEGGREKETILRVFQLNHYLLETFLSVRFDLSEEAALVEQEIKDPNISEDLKKEIMETKNIMATSAELRKRETEIPEMGLFLK